MRAGDLLPFPLLMLGAVLAAACAERSPDRDLVVGLIAPLASNPAARDGAIMAVDEINAGGGIAVGGHRERLRLIVEDSEEGPESAVSKALMLINRQRVLALVGLPRSTNAIPVASLAERHGVPLISTMSTHPETTAGKRYAFRMAFLDAFQGQALAELAFDDLGARRAAVLADAASTYSVYLAEVFGEAFRRRGGRLVASETFTEDQGEVADPLDRIRESGAEILFLPNHSRFVKEHARAARRSGITATFLGSDSWGHGIDPRGHPDVWGSYFSDYWAPDRADERTRAFIAGYRRKFGAPPPASAALSYDAVSVVAAAIRRRGADRESIRAGLAGLEGFQGVTGTIAFLGSGDPSRSIFIRKIDQDGQMRHYKEVAP